MSRPNLPFRTYQRAAVLFTLLALLSGGRAEAQRTDDCGRRECVTTPCRPMPCPMPDRVDQMQRTAREVRVTLDGRVLRYEVTERWTNRGRTLGEVDYVLPLPRGAAFEDLALEIDGERVTGEALDATKARRVYEEIVRKQKDPALVEWMGLGMLRTRIFPVAPGETRTVVVRFRAVAEREGDALRVDVPAPRGRGTMASGTALTLSWPTGSAFGDAWSPTHRADVTRRGARRVATVKDATGTVTMLVPVRATDRAAISVLAHAPRADDGYALITLTPPVTRRAATPRDLTFVVDVSGSMSGEKLAQAKAAGRQLLGSLAAGDRFRLIAFASDVQEFREGWSSADAGSRRAAERWLDDLRANGGTNIAGALDRALEVRESRDRLALVLFLTDGAPTVGERRADRLAARAAEQRGERRVFTFGLGEDVNAGLLEQVAIDGAGTAHFVRPEEDVERVVGVVAERLTSPVATDLRIRADGVTLHAVQPAGRLDLFAGQELTILARYRGDRTRGRVIITGQSVDGPVTWTAQANFPERRSADAFVGRLWATQRVGWLSAERRKQGPSRELDAEIRDLGERWGIPTELTSYLVLEPILDSPNAISQIGRGGTRVRTQGIGAASGNAPPPAVRAEEFEQAKQAASMREMRSVADLDAAAPAASANTRRTSTRQFTLRDSVWVDTRAEAPQARTLRVRPFSAAYFAAMERVPELREAFALGERVAVHGRAVTVILAADGEDTLSGTALAALTRDW